MYNDFWWKLWAVTLRLCSLQLDMANKEMFKSSDMVLFPSSMSLWHFGFDIMRFFDVSYICYKNKIYLHYNNSWGNIILFGL